MLDRHNLVWLSASGWQRAAAALPLAQQACAAAATQAASQAFFRWQQHDWPVIVRRTDPGAQPGEICVGLALPPDPESGVKCRIPFRVRLGDIRKIMPPLAIDAVKAGPAALPPPWRQPFEEFQRAAQGKQLKFGVYGSLAMQALTGLPYLGASSDIDLLFHPATVAQLEAGLALLEIGAEALPLDGEIVFPFGRAVAWKEWRQAMPAAGGARVMLKSRDAVSLVPADALLAALKQ